MHKDIVYGSEAREKIKSGVDKLAMAVTTTLGLKGRNVAIGKGWFSPQVVHDGVTVAKEVILKDPFENVGAQIVRDAASKTNESVGDGPQPLSAKVFTPDGFTRMGDLEVGDIICGTNLTTQKVLGVYEKGVREIYKVNFSGGRSVECTSDHLWRVNFNGKPKILTTGDMINKGLVKLDPSGNKRYNFYVENHTVEFNKKELPIDPYTLGVLLGDGSLTGTGAVEISLGLAKRHIIDKLLLPDGVSMQVRYDDKINYYRVRLSKGIVPLLKDLGLYGLGSGAKFIPKIYLYSSSAQRQDLLRGLVDTDGHINNRNLIEYSTVSDELKEDVLELLWGLGFQTHHNKHTRENDESYSDKPIYRIHVLKGYKYGVKITSIESTGKMEPVRCIKVSNKDELYITDNYIPTHNTTTATLLSKAIIDRAFNVISSGSNAMMVRRGVEKALEKAVDGLKEQAIPIKSKEERTQVASISAQSDEIGGIVAEAYERVGENGVVTFAESSGLNLEIEIKSGSRIDSGYISPYFMTNPATQESVIEDAGVLILDMKMSTVADVQLALGNIHKHYKRLVIIGDVEGEALVTLLLNRQRGVLETLVIKPPFIGSRKKEALEDLSAITGARLVSEDLGRTFDSIVPEDIGHADRVIASRTETVVIGGSGDKKEIDHRADQIKVQIEQKKGLEKEQLQKRLAMFSGDVAIIKVGASTEGEIIEKKLRVEDAINATKAAIDGGIVAGGGVALYQAREKIKELELTGDEKVGAEILYDALDKPVRKIVENAGREGAEVLSHMTKKNVGFNVLTMEYGDMVEMGVIDPVKVPISALTNAVSVSTLAITTDCIIVPSEEDNHSPTTPPVKN